MKKESKLCNKIYRKDVTFIKSTYTGKGRIEIYYLFEN